MRYRFFILLLLLMCGTNAHAQYGETTDDQKAKFLYNIPKYLLWENDENITTMYIGVVNSDPDLFKTLRREARRPYPGAGTKVVVKDYVSVADAANDPNINILYTSYSPDFRKALETFKDRPVAIISDNYVDQRNVMINFVDEKSGLVSFRYSSANLRKVGISVHDNITKDLHGDELSKDDIINDKDQQLRNTQGELSRKDKEIAAKQRLLDQKETEIYEKEHTIELQNRNIQRQTNAITEQNRRLEQQREEMDHLQSMQARTRIELEDAALQLQAKSKEVAEVAEELEKQKRELSEQQQLALTQQERIKDINDEIERKEAELREISLQNDLLNNQLLIAWIAVTLFAIMIFFIAKLYMGKRRDNKKLEEQNIAIRKASDEISRQKEEIAAKNDKIIESILYAQNIQTAVMPPREYFDQFLPDHFIMLKPRDIVSGDFYWGTHLGDKFVYTAADCTGHGVPGAFMSLLGISFLNEIVSRKDANTVTASDILDHLRQNVISYLRQSSEETSRKDGMDMALCVYDKNTNTLQYAGANNPLLIIRNNEILQFTADEMPIGFYENQTEHFTNHIIEIQPGDIAYMFSDGYPDQFGMVNGKKKKYLIKRFRDFLLQIHTLDMNQQLTRLEENLDQWRGDLKQLDDVLVMGVKY